jgi:hypothetical protein
VCSVTHASCLIPIPLSVVSFQFPFFLSHSNSPFSCLTRSPFSCLIPVPLSLVSFPFLPHSSFSRLPLSPVSFPSPFNMFLMSHFHHPILLSHSPSCDAPHVLTAPIPFPAPAAGQSSFSGPLVALLREEQQLWSSCQNPRSAGSQRGVCLLLAHREGYVGC